MAVGYRFRRGVLVCVALVAWGCSNPERDKVRHLERGNAYAAEKRDSFALVEYASAIQIDPRYGDARLKLAETYERMDNMREAIPEYVRAADALPDNRDLQLKATRLMLLAGRFDDAKARSATMLTKNPNDVDALLMHANALVALRDAEGAIDQIEDALKIDPDSSDAFVTLGAVRMRTGEAQQAETAFRRAIALAPSSVDPKLALANFLWATNRLPEAEIALREASAIQPAHLLTNRMLAVLLLATKRVKEAEAPLRAMAEASPTAATQLQLADYYAGSGRPNEATDILKPLAAAPATSVDAEARLAAIDYAAGRKAEAHARLDGVLTRVPSHTGLLVTKSQWLLAENRLDEALDRAKAAAAADPQSVPAQFVLATVHDRRGETALATAAYTEVLRLNPRAVAAQVELSRLSLAKGDRTGALQYAERARTAEPSNLSARVALARSLIAAGNFARAETEVAGLLETAPQAAVVHVVQGTLMASRNNTAGARAAFERSLQLSPGFLEGLSGLMYLDLQAKNPAASVARLEAESAKQPTNAPLLALLARAQNAAGNQAGAEQALRRAVSVDPRFTAAYSMLAQLYTRQGRLDAALTEFQGIVSRDSSATGARTMVGMLLEAQGKRDDAVKAYEATLSANPNAPVAANNLAFIYAERGQNLDVALELATTAKQRMPEDSNVDDTLGWIYYKRGQPQQAIPYLQASLKRRPDVAEVLYHLGMAYAAAGNNSQARQSLEQALKLDPKVGGDEARRTLATVSR